MHQASPVKTGTEGTAEQRSTLKVMPWKILLLPTPSLPGSFCLSLATHLEEDCCHATSSPLKIPGGKDLRTLFKSQRTKHSCQKPFELEIKSSFRWLQPLGLLVGNPGREPEPEHLAQLFPDSGPTETTGNKKISEIFERLILGVTVMQQQIPLCRWRKPYVLFYKFNKNVYTSHIDAIYNVYFKIGKYLWLSLFKI